MITQKSLRESFLIRIQRVGASSILSSHLDETRLAQSPLD